MAPKRGKPASGLGLIASVAALAAGGIALGIELERRIVAKRIVRNTVEDLGEFFSLRSDGPDVTTPDGVVLLRGDPPPRHAHHDRHAVLPSSTCLDRTAP